MRIYTDKEMEGLRAKKESNKTKEQAFLKECIKEAKKAEEEINAELIAYCEYRNKEYGISDPIVTIAGYDKSHIEENPVPMANQAVVVISIDFESLHSLYDFKFCIDHIFKRLNNTSDLGCNWEKGEYMLTKYISY